MTYSYELNNMTKAMCTRVCMCVCLRECVRVFARRQKLNSKAITLKLLHTSHFVHVIHVIDYIKYEKYISQGKYIALVFDAIN